MTTATTDAEAIARIIRLAIYDGSAGESSDERVRIAETYTQSILSYLASRREAQEPVQITMQDVRLMAGEGPLTAKDTLAAVNAHLRAMHRRTAPPEMMRKVLSRLHGIATAELRNTSHLLSSPPQSSAAWEIRNAISKELAALNGGRADG